MKQNINKTSDKRYPLPDSSHEHSWKSLSADRQASYRLNVMLADMEFEGHNYAVAADYFLKALSIFFRTDIYKKTVISIQRLPKKRQVDFLHRLGKCLLVHCHPSERAQAILHKLSHLDPSFLWPVQKFFSMNGGKTSVEESRMKVFLEKTTGQSEVRQPLKSDEKSPVDLENVHEPETPEAPSDAFTLEISEEDKIMKNELQISFEETGEHFRINRDLTDSTTIDKNTLKGLLDDLLMDESE